MARPQPENELAYDMYVSGELVATTLAEVQSFLWERAIPNQYAEILPWDPE